MVQVITQNERRTSVDEIFEELHPQIYMTIDFSVFLAIYFQQLEPQHSNCP